MRLLVGVGGGTGEVVVDGDGDGSDWVVVRVHMSASTVANSGAVVGDCKESI